MDPNGGTMEQLLEETGQREAIYATALKQVIAWQLEQSRQQSQMTKSLMAQRMGTSRSQVDRVLDPQNAAVSIEILARAAHAVGKKIRIEVVDADDPAAI